jgi:predicted Ser/Thr protein kinase
VEALTALVARLVGRLQGVTGDAVCPGGWPWAVTLLGVGVGLLPVAGAVAVALLRRGIGSRYGPLAKVVLVGTGVLTAGVLPLLVFRATGRVFAAAAADERVAGLTGRQLRSLDTAVCGVGPQSRWLGAGRVVDVLTAGSGARTGLALMALVGLPVVVALVTAVAARLAVRRGPVWPVRAFWLPLLSVAALTAEMPPGAAAHLWVGAAAGAFVGIPAVAAVGPPSRAVLARPGPGPSGAARPGEVRRSGAVPAAGGWGDRFAARFAARAAEPLVERGPGRVPTDAGPVGGGAAWVPGPSQGRPSPGGYSQGRPSQGRPSPGRPPPAGPRGTAMLGVVPGGTSSGAPPGHPVGPSRFRLVRRLGAGGFGSVWLAHDARLRRTVAVKAALVRDVDTEERIRREATALATVRHPHCVQILDLVAADGDPGLSELGGMVIVMEYVRGMSLGELVRTRGTVDDVAAARAWSSIAGALEAAHGCGVLHRDVKPANIVVDDVEEKAHLIDFGIARRTGDATLTAAGFVMGTPDFLAPEVAAGASATPESDAWQLAASIAYALCGQPPRGEYADAVSALRVAALGRPPTHLPSRSAHLALLQAALDAEPARRPSLREVQGRLDGWLRAAGVVADGPVTTVRR